MSDVRAYLCGVRGTDWKRIVNSESRGKAKSRYWIDITDAWPDVPFIAVTCRIESHAAFTPDSFLRTAEYRGMPDLRCGQHVILSNGLEGVLVGSNSSANFDVLINGQVWNVHPSDIVEVEP